MSWLRISAVMMVCLVSGCASRPASRSDVSANARAGAYYENDGPGDHIPTDLDRIPDAVPRLEPLHKGALKPYTALGQRFVPKTKLGSYRKRGIASWYGRQFHGKATAIGEPYDMYAMTAAHPTLPLPSYARVTNLANGRSVVVRVNDRGPFLRGRVMDLSYAAAHKLGYIKAGRAEVMVEAIVPSAMHRTSKPHRPLQPQPLKPVQRAKALPPSQSAPVVTMPSVFPSRAPVMQPIDLMAVVPREGVLLQQAPRQFEGLPVNMQIPVVRKEIFLQLGAFATRANAQQLIDRIAQELSSFAERLQLIDDGRRFRLHLGPFASEKEARQQARSLATALQLQPFLVFR